MDAPTPESRPVRWLRGNASDRARYRDMSLRFRNSHPFAVAVGGPNMLAAHWYGPALLLLVLVAGGTMAAAVAAHRRARRPEIPSALAFAALEANLAVAIHLSGGGQSPLLPLLAVPVFSQAICLRPPVFLTGVTGAALLAVPAVLLAPAREAAPSWLHLVAFVALLVSLSRCGLFLATADLHSRDEAVVDPMTGLFNRLSLSARFADAQRALEATGGAMGLVMCDVDHFKRINDTYGHAVGDRVLVELAGRLRSCLRASDVAFRVGGEEFVVLLPGRDAAAAQAVAERVRRAVGGTPVAGLPVTVSAGVACTASVQDGLAGMLRRADAALYAAKGAGRDRVVAAGADARPVGTPFQAAARG